MLHIFQRMQQCLQKVLHTWGNGVLYAKSFYKWCLHVNFPSFFTENVKLLIEGCPYPPWFLFWKKSFTLGGSMFKPFLGNCAQITGKTLLPDLRVAQAPAAPSRSILLILCILFNTYIYIILYVLHIKYKCIYIYIYVFIYYKLSLLPRAYIYIYICIL